MEVLYNREKLDLPAPVEWIYAMRTVSAYFSVQHFMKLSMVCSQLGIKVSGTHRAVEDRQLTLVVMKKMAGHDCISRQNQIPTAN